jgi:hypothetical protein
MDDAEFEKVCHAVAIMFGQGNWAAADVLLKSLMAEVDQRVAAE